MNTDDSSVDVVTKKIIGAAYTVANRLGCGFLEKVYENALAVELLKTGLDAHAQYPIHIYYDDILVGDYIADFMVENRVVVELKAVSALNEIHVAQCLNYLKATGIKVCLLVNFGKPKVEIRRLVL